MDDEALHASFLRSERYKESPTERFARLLDEESSRMRYYAPTEEMTDREFAEWVVGELRTFDHLTEEAQAEWVEQAIRDRCGRT